MNNVFSQSYTVNHHSNAIHTDQPLVERTNALSIEDFITHYVTPTERHTDQSTDNSAINKSESTSADQSPENTSITPLDVYSAATISPADLEACLDLIELTSSQAYAASGAGWSRPKKRKEMKLPDMKYLIVRGAGRPTERETNQSATTDQANVPDPNRADVLGFLSFMITYEDGNEVIYCYEIHLAPAARGQGLGGLLMSRMEQIGRSVGLEKAMLTVFKSNATARRFYQKGGYVVDEYSPRPRRLRNGTVKEFDYEILSKSLR